MGSCDCVADAEAVKQLWHAATNCGHVLLGEILFGRIWWLSFINIRIGGAGGGVEVRSRPEAAPTGCSTDCVTISGARVWRTFRR